MKPYRMVQQRYHHGQSGKLLDQPWHQKTALATSIVTVPVLGLALSP